MRTEIVAKFEGALKSISTTNGYFTDFDRVLLWQEIPAEYSHNVIFLRDTREKYELKGSKYTCTLRLEIIAIVKATKDNPASVLGNLALTDLIRATTEVSSPKAFFILNSAEKWLETKGITVAQIELNIDAKYQI